MSYKVVFRGAQPYKKDFKNSDCVLSISVGQNMHEGEKLEATIAFINARFRSCTLAVNDTLQRHTMAIKTKQDADFFYKDSLNEGDLWLARNKKYYEKLDAVKGIVRWDTWLQDTQYEDEKNKIILHLQNDPEYYKSFEETTEEFLTRLYCREKEPIVLDEQQQRDRQLCFDYLIEECAIRGLWVKLNCHFEVYPSKFVLPLIETHKKFILPLYPELLHAVALKFKRKNHITLEVCETLKSET